MPDPINPRLDDESLLEHILGQYPQLSRAQVVEMAAAFGWDLDVETELRPQALSIVGVG